MNLSAIILSSVLYAFQPAPHLQEVQLVRVTSDASAGEMNIRLSLDDDGKIANFTAIAPTETRTFGPEGLTAAGTVLFREQGKDIVRISSRDFDPAQGGELVITYLYSALSNKYRQYPMELNRHGQNWELTVNEKTGRRVFTSMYLKAKRLFGQVIGIASITVN